MNDNIATPAAPQPQAPPQLPLPELIVSLEQATLMAKQLPTTTDPTHLLQIYTSLHQAHHHLSSFVSTNQLPFFPPPPPPHPAENSLSSTTAAEEEPMQVGEDDDYEGGGMNENSKAEMEKVEERMRDCFIKNKRPKRPRSPLFVPEERRFEDDGCGAGVLQGYDPNRTRMKALDLIYQFHA